MLYSVRVAILECLFRLTVVLFVVTPGVSTAQHTEVPSKCPDSTSYELGSSRATVIVHG